MKKIVLGIYALLVGIASIMTIHPALSAPTPGVQLSIVPETITTHPGEIVTLTIRITPNGTTVLAAAPVLIYDTTQFTFMTIKQSQNFPHITSQETVLPGILSFTVSSPSVSQPITDSTEVATVVFKTSDTANGQHPISFGNDSFVGSLATGTNNALASSLGTTIIFTPIPTATPTPTATPKPTPTNTPTPIPPTATPRPTPTKTPTPTPTPQGTDRQPPTITIAQPKNNSTLPTRGTVTIKTSASDPSGVQKIAIGIDGITIYSCNYQNTCQYQWDVTRLPTGSHSISVQAQDASQQNNTAVKSILVTKSCRFRVFGRCVL